eukprot:COSAG01_NODE_5962_length_3931_cov_864.532620_5_plen_153_part_00
MTVTDSAAPASVCVGAWVASCALCLCLVCLPRSTGRPATGTITKDVASLMPFLSVVSFLGNARMIATCVDACLFSWCAVVAVHVVSQLTRVRVRACMRGGGGRRRNVHAFLTPMSGRGGGATRQATAGYARGAGAAALLMRRARCLPATAPQ